jgi:hypothetical protein
MEPKSDSQFKPPCPFCRGDGAANEVMMQGNVRTITYVCRVCAKAWSASNYQRFRGPWGDQPAGPTLDASPDVAPAGKA